MAFEEERHVRGLETLRRIRGVGAEAPLVALDDVAPALARFAIDFAYGEVLSRPGLDLRTRQICTVAALSAMGNAEPQLRWHVDGALDVGWEPSDLVSAVSVDAAGTGEEAVARRVALLSEVFAARGLNTPAASASGADRHRLDSRTSALVAVAAVTAVANVSGALEARLRDALACGVSRDEIVEVIEQMAVYAGFPAALNAIAVARRVFEQTS